MNISNTIYLNTPVTERTPASVALAPNATHTEEYLNIPVSGYTQPRFERAYIYFMHPTLALEFKMAIVEYIKITLKTSWNHALLVIGDDGKLYEYNPEVLTVIARTPVETFEHRRIVKENEKISDSEIFLVQSLNHKTMRATILHIDGGIVSKFSMSFNTLISNWNSVGSPVSTRLFELLGNAIKRATTEHVRWSHSCPMASFTEEGLVLEGVLYTLPVMAELIADAELQNKPLMIVNDSPFAAGVQNRPNQPLSFPFTPAYKLVVDTGLLAKFWYSLPIEGFSTWEKAVNVQRALLKKLPDSKGCYIDALSSNYMLLRHHVDLVIKELNELLRVGISTTPLISENGQFSLKRIYTVSIPEAITENQQLRLINAIQLRIPSTETIVHTKYVHPHYSLPQLTVETQGTCEPTLSAIEARFVEMLASMQGYAVLAPKYGHLPVRKQNQIVYDYEEMFPIVSFNMGGINNTVLSDLRTEID